jgi:site-specific recombinase XerD
MKTLDVSTQFTLPLEQATEGWLLHLKARNLSPMTVKAYRAAALGLAAFLRSSGMPTDVEAIAGEHIETYLASEVATKAAATAHQRYRGLKQLFKWLRSQGDIGTDPMATVQPPIVPEHHIATISDADFIRILKTCDESLEGLRDQALLRTLWDTGGRLAEVTGLRVNDVSFPDQEVTLFGKGRRTRTVYIAAATGAAIHRYFRRRARTRHGASEWLWTGKKGPMTPSGIRQMLWRRSDAAGLERRVHPHQLRHSKADAWLSAGGSELGLRKQMGWRSAVMVARYAARNAERRSIEEARRLGLGDRL